MHSFLILSSMMLGMVDDGHYVHFSPLCGDSWTSPEELQYEVSRGNGLGTGG